MQVVLAEFAGACYGVQRALDKTADAAAAGAHINTLGPLIHNPIVVDELASKGVTVAESADNIDADTVIIRSHGVTPDVRHAIESKGVHVIDATCPHVRKAQKAASELSKTCATVVVVGEAGHPEVEGLTAYAQQDGACAIVVGDAKDLPEDLDGCVGVVVQTTQRRELLEAVIERIKAQGIEPIVKDTICAATRQRQDAARDMAGDVDVVIVIGGRNSSNTTRLAEICASVCPRTYHIESPDEIEAVWFEECTRVGVTAGASTPESQIAAALEVLRTL